MEQQEDRVPQIADYLPGIVFQFILRKDGTITIPYICKRFHELFGIEPREVKADPGVLRKLMPSGETQELKRAITEATRNAVPFVREQRIIDPRGIFQWFLIEATPDPKPDGDAVWHGVAIDITALKRHEYELFETKALLEQTFNCLQGAVFLIDPLKRARVKVCNRAVERVFGYSREEMIGRSTEVLHVNAEMFDRFARMCESVLGGQKTFKTEYQMKRKNGEIFPTENIVTVLHRNKGWQAGVVTVVQDITERKRVAEEREKLQTQLFHSLKLESVGRLAGGIAHDFNNMLSVIIGHAEMALNEFDSVPAIHEDLREILDAANRSAGLTRQLLDFARKRSINPEVIDLNETVESTLKMLRRLIGEHIELLWKPGRNLWPVHVDASQVNHILTNLCVNARDAVAGEGRVTIKTQNIGLERARGFSYPGFVPGEYVLLAVSDTGSGMDQETLEHVFEPFFTTKESGRGTGLGLASVYGIVKQHNGFIYAHSEPEHGATFKIYFPRTEVCRAEEQLCQGEQEHQEGTETILIVEDEASLLALGKAILERRGYAVLAAHRPTEALRIAERHPGQIHLLITDVVMPGMNGRELKEKLDVIKPGLKCIFMSGYTANIISPYGVLDEGTEFLQKPFSVKTLAEKVRKLLAD